MKKFASYILFKLLGWRLDGEIPYDVPQLTIVFLPHTSNWDFVYGMLFVKALSLKLTLFGKNAFYFWPFTLCYRYFGVLPIERDRNNNFVQQAISYYDNDASLWTGIAPEGTRSAVEKLKTGYYYLAKGANVPLLVAGLDFERKVLVVKPLREVEPTLEADINKLLEFSRSLKAKRPQLAV